MSHGIGKIRGLKKVARRTKRWGRWRVILSPRETEALALAAIPLYDHEIAHILNVKITTVTGEYWRRILWKLRAKTRREAVKYGLKWGHIPPPTITREEAIKGVPFPPALVDRQGRTWTTYPSWYYQTIGEDLEKPLQNLEDILHQ